MRTYRASARQIATWKYQLLCLLVDEIFVYENQDYSRWRTKIFRLNTRPRQLRVVSCGHTKWFECLTFPYSRKRKLRLKKLKHQHNKLRRSIDRCLASAIRNVHRVRNQ